MTGKEGMHLSKEERATVSPAGGVLGSNSDGRTTTGEDLVTKKFLIVFCVR
uniref:Uncharacterized protein n=1 Tax=Arundo donax TaxID=35708 RepID=A0A0A9BBZ3_ARUDO